MRNITFKEKLKLIVNLFKYKNFLKKNLKKDYLEIKNWQFEKIKKIVNYAYFNTEFYKQKYDKAGFHPDNLKTWEDFEKIPFLTKDEIIENFPKKIISKEFKLEDLIISKSSGSSGKVVNITYDGNAFMFFVLAGLRIFNLFMKYGPFQKQMYVYTSVYPFDSILGLYKLIYVNTLEKEEKIIEKLLKHTPDLLVTYPSRLRDIKEKLTKQDIKKIGLKGISLNSEMSSQAERDEFEKFFECPVRDEYSSEELTRIAAQGKDKKYYIFEDINYIEIYDEKENKILKNGETGEIIGTNLWNYAMPLIRYKQGDFASIEEKDLEKNIITGFRIMKNIGGRKNDSFIFKNNKKYSSGFLLDATYDIILKYTDFIKDFCLIQEKEDLVIFELIPNNGFGDEQEKYIKQKLGELFEKNAKIEVKIVEKLYKTKSGKQNPIISKI